MPELPEVETIRKQLDTALLGCVFSWVEVRLVKQIRSMSASVFSKYIKGTRVTGVKRRAKMLAIETDKGYIVFHLKMTGQIIYQDKKLIREKQKLHKVYSSALLGGGHPIRGSLENLPNKYSHVIFSFKNGSKLFFNDTRQFGWVTFVKSEQEIENLSAVLLGPEPLSKDFTLEGFIRCMTGRPNSRVYQALLDQKCVVGVGNIYANESLYVAGIRPTRRNKDILASEYKKLYGAIIKLLTKAIEMGGTSTSDYFDALGNVGKYSSKLKVYQKAGKPCARKCGGEVKRMVIGARSSFYCLKCQK